MYKVIMAPTEGSDTENSAISVAVKLAQRFHADLRLVRVQTSPLITETIPRQPVLEITDPRQEFESANALGLSYRGDYRRVKKARPVAGGFIHRRC